MSAYSSSMDTAPMAASISERTSGMAFGM